MTSDKELRSLQARIAALTRVAREGGTKVATPAQKAFLKRFETEHRCKHCGVITIDQSLPDGERSKAVAAAMSAHFTRLALSSHRARHKARQLYVQARKDQAELAAGLADLDSAAS